MRDRSLDRLTDRAEPDVLELVSLSDELRHQLAAPDHQLP